MPGILVSPEELAGHLDDPDWVVFDTRHDLGDVEKGRRAYAVGHVPGAYFMHLDEDLSSPKTGKNGRHPLPGLAGFTNRMNASGVRPRTQVVIYDDAGGSLAARLWWLLRWLGKDPVALLDGGFAAWQQEGRPISQEVPAPRKGNFAPRPHLGWTVDAPFLEKFHDDAAVRLLDARAAERFAGTQEPIDPVAGHIPGAINRFWKDNLAPEGRFKPVEMLRKEFDILLAGAAPSQSVNMCGSGVTACHNIFAMELAGLPGARLYPGSWSEWCADSTRPMARNP
jgi:thiosulfate/3-mercaptopyruvate sulfurtransferase